jgi:hypothetical protein
MLADKTWQVRQAASEGIVVLSGVEKALPILSEVASNKLIAANVRSGAGFGLLQCGPAGIDAFKQSLNDPDNTVVHSFLNTAVDAQRSGANVSALAPTMKKLSTSTYPPIAKNAAKVLAEMALKNK